MNTHSFSSNSLDLSSDELSVDSSVSVDPTSPVFEPDDGAARPNKGPVSGSSTKGGKLGRQSKHELLHSAVNEEGDMGGDGGMEELPLWKLLLASCGQIGVELAWALEFSMAVPYFQQQIGLSPTISQGLWVFGPISGFVVAPIVGAFQTTSAAALAAGLVAVVLFSSIFSNSEFLSSMLGLSSQAMAVFACIAFACNDFSINVSQFPQRALISDMVPPSQQTAAQSMLTVNGALGVLLANGVIGVFPTPVAQAHLVFLVGNIIFAVSIAVTLAFAHDPRTDVADDYTRFHDEPLEAEGAGVVEAGDVEEVPERAPPPSALAACANNFRHILAAVVHLKAAMWKVLAVQALSWFAYFCVLTILTQFMAHVVWQGAEGTPEYETGVKMGSYGQAGRAVVMAAFCFLLPTLARRLGVRLVWGVSLLLLSAILQLLVHVQIKPLAVALVFVLGIPMAASYTFPFALVGGLYPDPSERGLRMGLLNWGITLPQLVDTAYTGALTETWDERAVLFVGSVWAFLSAFSVVFLTEASAVELAPTVHAGH
eukprot:CAMPEP_0177639016 /NCGR_PEP_ID=MMETSP0447-20121125/5798_1 /TAXON_ID=0 /ORGANISM="Stygamoeba regulata, Strain BSH-02190019" /LENGTH=541 /DNA_ID=CAMNT_0019141019 /DNA_START=372 /DNA_END=1998 /DNA_ORIENTATION=+